MEDNSQIAVQELYEYYKAFCSSQKIMDTVSDAANFSKVVKQRYPNIKTKKCRVKGRENPVSVFKNMKCSYGTDILEGGRN